jgi:hypothetical protein
LELSIRLIIKFVAPQIAGEIAMETTFRTLVTRVFFLRRRLVRGDSLATSLRRFADVEFDSAWQYQNAMSFAIEPNIKLMLFDNLLDEMSHADSFRLLANRLDPSRRFDASKARKVLVDDAAQIPFFLAYAHESERAICNQFEEYAHTSHRFPEVAGVFRSISVDERGHESSTREAVFALVGGRRKFNHLVRKVRLKKAFDSWTRQTAAVGDYLFLAWFGLTFLLAGAIFGRYCRARLAANCVHSGGTVGRRMLPIKLSEE